MNIKLNDGLFTADDIKKLEEKYNARYVCDTALRQGDEWADKAVAIFYQEEPHPHGSQYFGIFRQQGEFYICNAISAVGVPMAAVVADDGEVVFSRFHHDYRTSTDGSVFIDGGREYIRTNVFDDERIVYVMIDDGTLSVIDKDEAKAILDRMEQASEYD